MNDHSPHTSLLRWFDREKNDIFQFVEKVFLSLVIVVSRKTIPQKLFLLPYSICFATKFRLFYKKIVKRLKLVLL